MTGAEIAESQTKAVGGPIHFGGDCATSNR